jgi:hypothetical protein
MDFFLICLCTERGVCTLMHEFYRTRHAVTPKDPLTPLLPEFNLCGSKRSIGVPVGPEAPEHVLFVDLCRGSMCLAGRTR